MISNLNAIKGKNRVKSLVGVNEFPQGNGPQCFYNKISIRWPVDLPLVHVNYKLQHVYHAPEVLQGKT